MTQEFISSPVLERILKSYVEHAEKTLKAAVIRENKVLTGEMLNAIRAGAVERGKDFISGHVNYSMLQRIRDMKTLNYTTVPPLPAMVKFVEKIGPDRFPVVSGYQNGKRPQTYTATVQRIAASLQNHFRREPNVKRGYRGIYNDPLKTDILPRFYRDLREHAGAFGLQQLSLIFSDK